MKRIITPLFLLLFSMKVISQTVPTAGLVGYWPFNNNANDESGNTLDGIVYGATSTLDRFGNTNAAYSFDGVDDYIDLGNSALLDRYNTSFTLSAWVKLDANPPGYSQPFFTNRGTFDGSELCIDGTLQGFGGHPCYLTRDAGTLDIIQSATPIDLVDFHHIVIVYQYSSGNNSVKVYVDNVLSNQATGFMDIPMPTQSTLIGWGPVFTEANRHFDGIIDDIRFYDRDLNASEVQSLFEETTGVEEIETITNFTVFPNPSVDVINISSSNQVSNIVVKIINSLGAVVYSNELDQLNMQIQTNLLGAKGIYIIQFVDKTTNIVTQASKLILK